VFFTPKSPKGDLKSTSKTSPPWGVGGSKSTIETPSGTETLVPKPAKMIIYDNILSFGKKRLEEVKQK